MVLLQSETFGNTQAKVPSIPSDCYPSEGISHSAFFSLSDLCTFKPYRACVYTCRTAGGPYVLQNIQSQTTAIPQTLHPIQEANRILTPTLTKNAPYPYNDRSAAESKLAGMKQHMLLEPCIPQRRPPDIVSGDLSVPPPTLSKHAALGHARWVESEYGSLFTISTTTSRVFPMIHVHPQKFEGVKIKALRQDA